MPILCAPRYSSRPAVLWCIRDRLSAQDSSGQTRGLCQLTRFIDMQELEGVMPTPQPLLEAMHSHLIRDEPRELGNVIVLTKCALTFSPDAMLMVTAS